MPRQTLIFEFLTSCVRGFTVVGFSRTIYERHLLLLTVYDMQHGFKHVALAYVKC
jgi:hypothetical protein